MENNPNFQTWGTGPESRPKRDSAMFHIVILNFYPFSFLAENRFVPSQENNSSVMR